MTRKRMMVCELALNCSAEVTDFLPITDEEQKVRDEYCNKNKLTLHRLQGDKLKASAITVYIDTRRRLTVDVKEGLTSTHGGHLISCNTHTLAFIKYPFVAITQKFLTMEKR